MNLRSLAVAAMSAGVLIASPRAQAPKPDPKTLAATGILERLAERSGVYAVPPTAKVPGFIADAGWPQKLPNNWIIGQVGGLYVAPDDHIWIYQRPRSLTNDEAALTGATHKDKDGKPVDALGFARPSGSSAYCCLPAPSIMEFDAGGALLRAWGGPADPEKCKTSDGCVWPSSEHGIFVDHNGFVYIGGSNANAAPNGSAWSSTRGADGMVLKFTKDGKFVMMIGGPGAKGPDSNNTNGGSNGTPQFYLPADITVDPATNRMFVSDGYGNRRVVIADAATGKYLGHFGAYGNNPVDDKAAADAGPWMNDFDNFIRGNMKPAFFRNPVHCARLSKDGLIYVCDRGNNRVQVFNGRDPNLGTPCVNRAGETGKCGFVKEKFVAVRTLAPPLPGSAVSMNFSTDARQSCLYVGDNTNQTIYVLKRDTLEELGRLGRSGREAGEFHWLHQVGVDSRGNLYTGEVDTGKRLQKFLRYGAEGCSGTGRSTVGELLP
jgi:DNA-binding beta-propeller fold protein YncE